MQARLIIATLLLVLPPPLALLLGGQPLAPHFRLPPAYEYQTGGAFSPLGATLLCLTAGGLILLAGILLSRRESKSPLKPPEASHRGLPARSWGGLALLIAGAAVAAVAGTSTGGTLMLIGATLLLDGDTWRRSGSSLLAVDRAYFLTLYPLGLLPGWGAEYLNRFVEIGSMVPNGGQLAYVVGVSLPAMALLPAAIAARQWLGVAGLLGGTLWREELYAVAWLSPLVLLLAVHLLTGGSPSDSGRWLTAMGGGLIPGMVLGVAGTLGHQWALNGPFAEYHRLGVALLGATLFAVYGLSALLLGDWLAQKRQGKTRPRRRITIPIRVEPPSRGSP